MLKLRFDRYIMPDKRLNRSQNNWAKNIEVSKNKLTYTGKNESYHVPGILPHHSNASIASAGESVTTASHSIYRNVNTLVLISPFKKNLKHYP